MVHQPIWAKGLSVHSIVFAHFQLPGMSLFPSSGVCVCWKGALESNRNRLSEHVCVWPQAPGPWGPSSSCRTARQPPPPWRCSLWTRGAPCPGWTWIYRVLGTDCLSTRRDLPQVCLRLPVWVIYPESRTWTRMSLAKGSCEITFQLLPTLTKNVFEFGK